MSGLIHDPVWNNVEKRDWGEDVCAPLRRPVTFRQTIPDTFFSAAAHLRTVLGAGSMSSVKPLETTSSVVSLKFWKPTTTPCFSCTVPAFVSVLSNGTGAGGCRFTPWQRTTVSAGFKSCSPKRTQKAIQSLSPVNSTPYLFKVKFNHPEKKMQSNMQCSHRQNYHHQPKPVQIKPLDQK